MPPDARLLRRRQSHTASRQGATRRRPPAAPVSESPRGHAAAVPRRKKRRQSTSRNTCATHAARSASTSQAVRANHAGIAPGRNQPDNPEHEAWVHLGNARAAGQHAQPGGETQQRDGNRKSHRGAVHPVNLVRAATNRDQAGRDQVEGDQARNHRDRDPRCVDRCHRARRSATSRSSRQQTAGRCGGAEWLPSPRRAPCNRRPGRERRPGCAPAGWRRRYRADSWPYSDRSACRTSTREARAAGMSDASTAAVTRTAAQP